VKQALEDLQASLLQVERSPNGISARLLTGLVGILKPDESATEESPKATKKKTVNIGNSTVNNLLARWENIQFPQNEHSRYLLYLRQIKSSSTN